MTISENFRIAYANKTKQSNVAAPPAHNVWVAVLPDPRNSDSWLASSEMTLALRF